MSVFILKRVSNDPPAKTFLNFANGVTGWTPNEALATSLNREEAETLRKLLSKSDQTYKYSICPCYYSISTRDLLQSFLIVKTDDYILQFLRVDNIADATEFETQEEAEAFLNITLRFFPNLHSEDLRVIRVGEI